MSFKQLLAGVLFVFLGLISLGIWMAVGLGKGPQTNTPRSRVAEDQSATARLIEQRVQERNRRRVAGSLQLENTDKPNQSQPNEAPDGILYLGARYRQNDIDILLDRVEFYPSVTRAYLTISNESNRDLSLDPRGTLLQKLPTFATQLELVSAPQDALVLAAGEQQQLALAFSPANGRMPFSLVFGPLQQEPQEWSARFEVDPESIVKSLDN